MVTRGCSAQGDHQGQGNGRRPEAWGEIYALHRVLAGSVWELGGRGAAGSLGRPFLNPRPSPAPP